MYVCMYLYIYIYIYRWCAPERRSRSVGSRRARRRRSAPDKALFKLNNSQYKKR